MLFSKKKEKKASVPWQELKSKDQIDAIVDSSQEHPVMIFKHSTRCSISSMALSRLEREWQVEAVPELEARFLDLISHRDISAAIAEKFGVEHESPQVLVIDKGSCVYHNSHGNINFADLKKFA